MDRILIIMKKNNGHQGIICPFTGAFFHNMQTCLLVYTYNRSRVSVYRTIGPLVLLFMEMRGILRKGQKGVSKNSIVYPRMKFTVPS